MLTIQGALTLALWLALLSVRASDAYCPAIDTVPTGRCHDSSEPQRRIWMNQQSNQYNITCSWTIEQHSEGLEWLVQFHQVHLESSDTGHPCQYDNLTVTYNFNDQRVSRVLCGSMGDLSLVTNGSVELKFQSDASISYSGFTITWCPVSSEMEEYMTPSSSSLVFHTADSNSSICKSLTSTSEVAFNGGKYTATTVATRGMTGTDLAIDCAWTMEASGNNTVYLTFDYAMLDTDRSCSLDNFTVLYQLPGRSRFQRNTFCRESSSRGLIGLGTVSLQLQLEPFKYANAFNFTWFVAPYNAQAADAFEINEDFLEEQCTKLRETVDASGELSLFYKPPTAYVPRMRCSWIVSVPEGKVVDFHFHEFDLAPSNQTWRRSHNVTFDDYCPNGDDVLKFTHTPIGVASSQEEQFCWNNMPPSKRVALTSTEEVDITFSSGGYSKKSHGFALWYVYRKKPAPRYDCPSVRQVDGHREEISNSTQYSKISSTSCTWIVKPRPDSYLALTLTLHSDIPHDRRCDPMVFVSSQSSVISDVAALTTTHVTSPMGREFCFPVVAIHLGLFSGPVNVTIGSGLELNIRGFNLSIVHLPKPQPGCFNLSTDQATSHSKSQIAKRFLITAEAGCVASERLTPLNSPAIRSTIPPKVTFKLACKPGQSTGQQLEVISEKFTKMVKCGASETAIGSWEYPLILKFPAGTAANLTTTVEYEFPVLQDYCTSLNSKTAPLVNGTTGSYHMPLFIDPVKLPASQRDQLSFVSCNYELAYRPGYSIQLKLEHNLGYDDLDFYCHLKLLDRQVNPHILLTAKEQVSERPGEWTERQLEVCHGHSVGTLGAKPGVLIDGAASINLLAMSVGMAARGGGSSSDAVAAMRLWRVLNYTMAPEQLQFLITYKYVPSCPELTCRSENGSKSNCSTDQMTDVTLEASLELSDWSQRCRWNLPNDPKIRSALAAQSRVWLLRLEVSNFFVPCPCHGCNDADDFQEYITASQLTASTTGVSYAENGGGPEKVIICGYHLNSSKVVYMPVGQGQPDVQLAYWTPQPQATVRVGFVDCLKSYDTVPACREALRKRGMLSSQFLGSASHGGLAFAAFLLAATLIGSLLYMNRQALMSGRDRIQEHLMTLRPQAEDQVQLHPGKENKEPEEPQQQ